MDGRHWLSRLFRAISRDQSGNAAVVFCFCAVPLAAGAGLAIDTMLAYSVEDQLQKSLDAAGLAAGRTASPEDVEADARSYFNTNFDAGTGFARLDDFDVVVVLGPVITNEQHARLLVSIQQSAARRRRIGDLMAQVLTHHSGARHPSSDPRLLTTSGRTVCRQTYQPRSEKC